MIQIRQFMGLFLTAIGLSWEQNKMRFFDLTLVCFFNFQNALTELLGILITSRGVLHTTFESSLAMLESNIWKRPPPRSTCQLHSMTSCS